MKLLGFLVLSLASAKIVVEYVTVTAFVTVKKEQLGAASAGFAELWQSSTHTPVVPAETEAHTEDSDSNTVESPETSTVSPTQTQLAQTLSWVQIQPLVEVSQTQSSQAQASLTQTPLTQSVAQIEQTQSVIQTSSSLSTTLLVAAESLSSGAFSGDGTYYAPGMGACGEVNTESDYIVAVSKDLFDQYTPNGNPNKNTLCGKKIQAYYEGKSVEVTVVDRCEGCAYGSLDFSPTAFSQIADQSLGRIPITWNWV